MNNLKLTFKHGSGLTRDEQTISFKTTKEGVEINGGSEFHLTQGKDQTLDIILGHAIFSNHLAGESLLELESDEVVPGENINFYKEVAVYRNYTTSESKWRANGYPVGPNTNRKLNFISSNLGGYIVNGTVSSKGNELVIECPIKLPIIATKAITKDTDKLIAAVKTGLLPKEEALVAGLRTNDKTLVEALVEMVDGDSHKCGVYFQENGNVVRLHTLKGNKNLLGLFKPNPRLLWYLVANDLAEGMAYQEAQGIPWAQIPTQLTTSSKNNTVHSGIRKLGLYLTPAKLELKGKPLEDGLGQELLRVAAKESAVFSYISPITKVLLEAGADLEYGLTRYSDNERALALKRAILELPDKHANYFKTPLSEIKTNILATNTALNNIVAKQILATPKTEDDQEIEIF